LLSCLYSTREPRCALWWRAGAQVLFQVGNIPYQLSLPRANSATPPSDSDFQRWFSHSRWTVSVRAHVCGHELRTAGVNYVSTGRYSFSATLKNRYRSRQQRLKRSLTPFVCTKYRETPLYEAVRLLKKTIVDGHKQISFD